MKNIADIQYITQDSTDLSHAQQAKLMFETGITWVQIRMKNASKDDIQEEAAQALKYAQTCNGTLIINDSIEICKNIGAHGVHLGLQDIPIDEARRYLGDNFIIGGTANTVDDICYQLEKGADYVGLGPFRFTTTKKNLSPVIGLEGYKTIVEELKKRNISIPIVAVGGIQMEDIETIKETGMYGVAISTNLLESRSINL